MMIALMVRATSMQMKNRNVKQTAASMLLKTCWATTKIDITKYQRRFFNCNSGGQFSIPLGDTDVECQTQTHFDNSTENVIDDHWIVDKLRLVSDSWVGRARFQVLSSRPPSGYKWGQGRLTNIQETSRSSTEVGTTVSHTNQLQERQHWKKN